MGSDIQTVLVTTQSQDPDPTAWAYEASLSSSYKDPPQPALLILLIHLGLL